MAAPLNDLLRMDVVSAENFRPFVCTKLSLHPRFTLLVGDNGSGKTAVLEALAVALGGFLAGIDGEPGRGVMHHDVRTEVSPFPDGGSEMQFPCTVSCTGSVVGGTLTWTRTKRSRNGRTRAEGPDEVAWHAGELQASARSHEPVTLPLICYYGTGRLWKWERKRQTEPMDTPAAGPRTGGYSACLQSGMSSHGFVSTFKKLELVSLQRGTRLGRLLAIEGAVRRCVEAEIPPPVEVCFDFRLDDIVLGSDGGPMPFSLLSDGYRNMLAMVGDMALRAGQLNPHLGADCAEQTPGVVLIDEIDLHLHPKWQRTVVDSLGRAFPLVQFVATTHSPFIIQGLTDGAIVELPGGVTTTTRPAAIERIAHEIQGVPYEDVRSGEVEQERIRDLDDVTDFLADPEQPDPAVAKRVLHSLDRLIERHSDDPSFCAILKSEARRYQRRAGLR